MFTATAALASSAFAATGADDWHKHGSEKISSVASRIAGPGWTINWQAGSEPTVDSDALWKNGVLMDGTKDLDGPYVAVNRFFGNVSHVNPTWAFAACWNQPRVLTIVPMEHALDKACKRRPV